MGRPAVPLNQFVLKVHSRCDLACDHCYVYEGADQSWRGRPMAMPDKVITQTARRIAEHARAHQLTEVHAVLHGGEPLLAGPARLARVAGELRSALAGTCHLDLRIHTNGVLLDERFCDLFAEHGIKVGISIDGHQAANDRHRRYADGRSSYAKVTAAIGLLRGRYRELYAGLLCTIDVANDPVAVYDALVALEPPRVDFLLPHATWSDPPAQAGTQPDPYADWLIAVFDRWQAGGRPVEVRTFDSIISTSRGGPSFTEALGLGPSSLVVIETDGAYEQADSLKTAFHGAPATGFDVFGADLDTVAQHPGITARQQGLGGLCQTCQDCPVVTSCGGGLYAHRYQPGTGFANPSVYCPDLLKLITHIRSQLAPAPVLPARQAHAVPEAEFRALAAGFGDAAAISRLADAQHSLRRALLAAVYQAGCAATRPAATRPAAGPALPAPAPADPAPAASPAAAGISHADLRAAWSVLSRIDQENPEVLAAVLGHPYIRVWAVRCLEQLKAGQPAEAGLGHLGAIAAATAIRAGLNASLTIPINGGAIHLPTFGRLVLGGAQAAARLGTGTGPGAGTWPAAAAIQITDGAAVLRAGTGRWVLTGPVLRAGGDVSVTNENDQPGALWQPVRRLTAPGICVALEDTDPYRDCHQWDAAPRLAAGEVARWQHQFTQAWQEIERRHGAYAAALAEGLTTVMPLAPAPAGRDVSATARHAFGAVAAALPDGPVTLALLLIHEFQHVKMGAMLDLYNLYDPADGRLFHAPWREDPRPLEGLLQGTYAHLAVA
ncbi:MAG TPA: FxsB family cyclophane-forming radical SAM/SPASM peptide maturase, partial [Streptosporangiaceae bacterium]|nr:FxsB family cyclophane-forming radical SAM/SPASM peptide maturase [Streptosporangiaceae bacterium]